jgi:site-specific DNA-methyltransferase (adenine-specific)
VALLINRLHLGDCVEKLAEIDPGSIDLVFADPPFNIGYEYDVYDDRRSSRDYLEWTKRWLAGVHRCLQDNGTCWLAIGDEFAAEIKVLAQSEIGFHCRSWVIWYYTFGVNCARGFSRSHTHLFHFVKNPKSFVFNAENPLVRVASARQLVYADGRANPRGRLPDNTWILRPQDAAQGFRPDHDTWYFARVAGTFNERQGFHGCQMPEQLLGRIIRVSSNPGDVVLDPFAGSGTTLAVAKKLGRQWIGIELSPEYVARITERLNAVGIGNELNGPADPVQSAPTTKRGRSLLSVRKGRSTPRGDDAVSAGVIRAFEHVHRGYSSDYVLCDPELSQSFTQACTDAKLAGAANAWKRLLLRLRKSGQLKNTVRTTSRPVQDDSENYSFASEIAMRILELDFGMTMDEVLCSTEGLAYFDQIAQELAPGFPLVEYRWAALAIRKRATVALAQANSQFPDWKINPLPKHHTIADQPCPFQGEGVYILASETQTLYVGESQKVEDRWNQIVGHPTWKKLGLSRLQFIAGEPRTLPGLQSALIGRTQPLFNTDLLRPGRDALPSDSAAPPRPKRSRSRNKSLAP